MLCQSAVRERQRLAKYVKYIKASLFYFYFFSRTRLLKQPVHVISREMSQNTRDVRKCLFGVHTMAYNILGFNFPKNSQKWMALYKHVRASANGLKTNDVIED